MHRFLLKKEGRITLQRKANVGSARHKLNILIEAVRPRFP